MIEKKNKNCLEIQNQVIWILKFECIRFMSISSRRFYEMKVRKKVIRQNVEKAIKQNPIGRTQRTTIYASLVTVY